MDPNCNAYLLTEGLLAANAGAVLIERAIAAGMHAIGSNKARVLRSNTVDKVSLEGVTNSKLAS